jgi:alpha-glucosidase
VEAEWWKTAVIYQIYPRSFQDSNGDGVGDLNGIRRRLPHLATLGVDAVWIGPFYPSPMADFGYDVADYRDVDPRFGTLADCKALIAEAHALGLKVILDFVPNHTSDRHPWFIESRSSRNNPKRDWYIWKDARPGGGPPNNWVSHFGGSAWEWDEASGQYYYHAYLKEQPDLNWRNPEVRNALYDVLRFWLKLGVDGFHVDVIWHLMKDPEFSDNPPNLDYRPGQPEIDRFLPIQSADQPEVHEVIEDMRAVVDEYPRRVLIGEIYLPLDRLMEYYGRDLKGAHLPSISSCCKRRGRPTPLPGWWKTTRRRCQMAPGPTGCSATTTGRASPRGLGPSRRKSQRCCC